jgi:xanthine dehydrogenase molybdopterin-binding subunit B
LRHAVASLADHRLPVALDAPATRERVLAAVVDMRERAAATTAPARKEAPVPA